ncbi:MAG: hypothetical protein RLZ88_425 [Actinomycetota bacterium]
MRKVLIGSAVVLAVFMPVTASAAIADEPKPGASAWPAQPSEDDDSEDRDHDHDDALEDRMHEALESRYGKHGSFQIPPLVLRPGPHAGEGSSALGTSGVEPILLNPTVIMPSAIDGIVVDGVIGVGSTIPGGTNSTGNGSGSNPQGVNYAGIAQTTVAATPIDFARVQLNQQTPAQQFFNVATIGLAALAAAAVALGGTVGVRALREWRAERS